MAPSKPVRLAVLSLGCPKNLVDTERALGQMISSRVAIVDDMREADWVLVNTCGFIEEAKTESIETILEIAELKKDYPHLKIAVAGCLSERYGERLSAELTEADFFTGILTRSNVKRLLAAMTSAAGEAPYGENDDRQRLRITPPHFAYVRISEGCDNRCAYCAIPLIRGPLRSRPLENVLADAADLVADGAVEFNVIAQDTTSYGVDLYGAARLPELLAELARINSRGWVRLLYAHPAHFSEEVMAALEKGLPIVPYVDLPLQHINDRLLAAMGRKVTRARVEEIIREVRRRIPGVYIRTAFIVGFPGETQAQFDELIEFMRETRFERLGAFVYSAEEDTAAAAMPGQLSEKEKVRRYDILMRTQAEIAREQNMALVGKRISGIIDSPSGRDDLPLAGRTWGDAPEVDGTVFTGGDAAPGDLVEFIVTGVEDYDLVAEIA